MAEAYSAIHSTKVSTNAHKQKCDPLRHEVQLAISDEGAMLFVPHPRHMARGIIRVGYRFANKLNDQLWPLGSGVTAVIIALFAAVVCQSSPDSWLRSGLVATAVWEVDRWLPSPWNVGAISPTAHLAYLSVLVAIVFLLGVMMLQRLYLRVLLHYHGWLFEPKTSLATKLWGMSLKAIFLAGRRPLLFSFQAALPRLSVPALDATLRTFLASVKPLLSAADFATMADAAAQFAARQGPVLQRYLVLKSWVYSNYVSDWWEQFVYLRGRSSLLVSSNYYGLGASGHCPTPVPHARAATLVHLLFKFKQLIDREQLHPLVLRGVVPLCMDQYRRLFSTTRVPGKENDTLLSYEAKHIAVLFRGAWYRLDVFDNFNRLCTPHEIQQSLADLMAVHARLSPPSDTEGSLAALTATDRTAWATVRGDYFDVGLNKESLNCIESAAFVLCLDSAAPQTWTEAGRASLAGTGANRWVDKSLSLLVYANGTAAVHAEHAWGDAPVTAHCWEYVNAEERIMNPYDKHTGLVTNSISVPRPWFSFFRCKRSIKAPMKLTWDLSSASLKEKVSTALEFSQAIVCNLDLTIVRQDSFGKGFIKTCRQSPDAFIQMALQLAFFRDQGAFALTYESAMTRLFLNGRTETIRSLSEASCAFVRAMADPAVPDKQRVRALHAAAEAHKLTSSLAMAGMGVDRHLFALYVVSRGRNYETAFLEKALAIPWRLSTSQLPQRQTTSYPEETDPKFFSPSGGFGPVSQDGYGVSYMIAGEDHIYFHVSANRLCKLTDSKRMAENILRAFEDIRAIFS